MKSKLAFALFSFALLVCALSVGCGGHGGTVQETEEMTFDQMAEMAAQETNAADQAAETGDK